MRRSLVAVFLISTLIPAFSQTKRPFTFEDMMKLKRVGEPVPSPDGKWVLFSAVDVDLAANKKTPHIWIVPLNAETKAGPSTAAKDSQANPSSSLGMTSSKERVLIPDQDGDRPRWAPDGKRFAFISNKEGGSQVWIAEFDGAAGAVTGVYRWTYIATEASGELWSPDGKNILFTSDVYPECDGTPDAEAVCNAKRLKEAEDSKVKALIFDHLLYRHWNAYKAGKRTHIFVVSTSSTPLSGGRDASSPVFQPVSLQAQPTATTTQTPERRPPNTSDYLPVRSGPAKIAKVPTPRDLTPGDYDAPVFSLGGQDDYAFSPDGQEICYTSNHDKVPATSTNNDLWIVPVNWPPDASPGDVLAKTKNVTADNPASDSTPLYSPDGKYIAYRAQQRPGYESDRFRLMLYDRKTGEKKNLTEAFDRWVETFTWAPNSSDIYFVAADAGEAHIYISGIRPYRAPAGLDIRATLAQVGTHESSAHEPQAEHGYRDDLAITSDGKRILFTEMSLVAPNEIYSSATTMKTPCDNRHKGEPQPGDCEAPKSEPLTHVNDSMLSQIEMQPLEPFWFTGAYGDKVEGFLVKPPNFDPAKKYPLKFIIHGGPEVPLGDEWSYRWNGELFAANGYVVVEINFHGSPGYGQKFIDSINGDWGGAPFEDLMKGLDYAEKTYPFIDKDRECALGASFGGYMANWVLGHTDRFKCIVTHDGMFNTVSAWGTTEELWFNDWEFKGTPYTNPEMYEKWNPRLAAKNFKTPTLVIHGQLDYRLDVSEGLQLFTTLQIMGVPSKMLYFPDEGHWVLKPQNSQLWYKTVNDWVDQWVGKK